MLTKRARQERQSSGVASFYLVHVFLLVCGPVHWARTLLRSGTRTQTQPHSQSHTNAATATRCQWAPVQSFQSLLLVVLHLFGVQSGAKVTSCQRDKFVDKISIELGGPKATSWLRERERERG